jgi:acyl-coenzyme A synthetase/AMP-(fatty) acid ligase
MRTSRQFMVNRGSSVTQFSRRNFSVYSPAYPSVQVVAVGAVPDAAKGEAAHAFIGSRARSNATADDSRAYCRERLAAYKVRKDCQFVIDLPKTSTGTIVRRALRDLVAERDTAPH